MNKGFTDVARLIESQKYKIKREHPRFRERPVTHDFNFTRDFILYNRMIGNPFSKITNKLQDMAPFQEHYHDAIQDHHTIEFLKSRKLGATETWNRSTSMNCFDRYMGHDVMVIAGNEVKIATEILIRFDELFRDKRHDDGYTYAFKVFEPEFVEELDKGVPFAELQNRGTTLHHEDIIRKANFGTNPKVEFKNDTRVMAFAASRQEKAQSFRGTDDVIAAFISEAAHTGMKNDQPIMTALEPNLAQRDDGDLVLETTGNGRRGFFFNYFVESMRIISENTGISIIDHQALVDYVNNEWRKHGKLKFILDWWPLRYDYHIGIKEHILSKKYIEKQKRSPKLDFAQEYEAAFTSTYTQAIRTEDLSFKDTTTREYKPSIDLLGKSGIDREYGDVGYN